jgi:hypothetical protein
MGTFNTGIFSTVLQPLPLPQSTKNTIATVATAATSLISPTGFQQSIAQIQANIAAAGGLSKTSRYRVSLNAANIIAQSGITSGNSSNSLAALGNSVLAGLATARNVNAGSALLAANSVTNALNGGLAALDMSGRLTLFCDGAEFPSREFTTTDVRHYGPTYRQPYQSTYPTLNLEFYVGDDMAEKYFFEAWQAIIENPNTQNFNYYDNYITTIEIDQVSDAPDFSGNDVTYICKLYDAWPIGIGNLQLAYGDKDQYHRLPVQFAFRRWVNNYYDNESGSSVYILKNSSAGANY